MKPFLTLVCLVSATFAGPTIVYVSESGENRIAVWALDETTGELTRQGETALTGAPGSLALSPDHRHLYASVRSAKQFATLDVDAKTGALSNATFADAGFNAAYVFADQTGRWLLAASYSEGVVGLSAIQNGRVTGLPVVTLETGKKAHSPRSARLQRRKHPAPSASSLAMHLSSPQEKALTASLSSVAMRKAVLLIRSKAMTVAKAPLGS